METEPFFEETKKKKSSISMKPDIYDIATIAMSLSSCFLTWYFLKKEGMFLKIHQHFLASKNVYVATSGILSGQITNNISYFPIYPLILKFFWGLHFMSQDFASCLLCIITTSLSTFMFRRFIQSFSMAKSCQIIATFYFAVFPPAASYLRSMDSEYSLFVFLFSSLFVLRFSKKIYLIYILEFLITWTSGYGVLACVGFALSVYCSGDVKKAVKTLVFGVASFFALLGFHKYTKGSFFAMVQERDLDDIIPFKRFMITAFTIQYIREFHAIYGIMILSFFGAFTLLDIDKGVFLYCMLGMAFGSCKLSPDQYGHCAFFEFVAVILGFIPMFKNKNFNTVSYFIIPLFMLSFPYIESRQVSRGVWNF